ncbi:MAG: IspD/TarI family cytidylyltransferase [Bacteroidales bacterium]
MPCLSYKSLPAYAVLVAGGQGLRMNQDRPKQFLFLNEKPILLHTFERFYRSKLFSKIVIVISSSQKNYWIETCKAYDWLENRDFILANGGDSRFDSVYAGLQILPSQDEALVAVHDGIRLFVSTEFISQCLEQAYLYQNAIPCTIPVESFRYMNSDSDMEKQSHTINRNLVRSIQTPQCSYFSVLKNAFEQAKKELDYPDIFTDEASVLEHTGNNIHLCSGLPQNIKITQSFDLIMAEYLLNQGY